MINTSFNQMDAVLMFILAVAIYILLPCLEYKHPYTGIDSRLFSCKRIYKQVCFSNNQCLFDCIFCRAEFIYTINRRVFDTHFLVFRSLLLLFLALIPALFIMIFIYRRTTRLEESIIQSFFYFSAVLVGLLIVEFLLCQGLWERHNKALHDAACAAPVSFIRSAAP